MDKKYRLGLICGRFSHIHKGHQLLIDKALELCENVLILVGSAQEKGTIRNPFDVDFRTQLIKKVYKNNNIRIEKLNDMSNEYIITHKWGQYVINNTKKYFDEFADVIITGNDDLRKGWFSKEQMKNTEEIIIDRKLLDISATELRGYLLINDRESWSKYVPEEIVNDFEEIRRVLLKVESYNEIYKKIENECNIENYKRVYEQYEEEYKKDKLKNMNN